MKRKGGGNRKKKEKEKNNKGKNKRKKSEANMRSERKPSLVDKVAVSWYDQFYDIPGS